MSLIFSLKSAAKRIIPQRFYRSATNHWASLYRHLPLRVRQAYRLGKWNSDFHNKNFPITVVAIETIGNCNRSCVYCPVSIYEKRKGRMETDVFKRIIRELRDLDYRGEVFMHFFNEPLLDKRIFEFVEFVRQNLPNNFFKFVTNGDLLTAAGASRIVEAGISELAISLHDADAEKRIVEILEELPTAHRAKIRLFRYYDTENHDYSSRGGTINGEANNLTMSSAALLDGCDKTEFNIDYQGNVHPCCEDFENGYILGNVNQQSLYDIWMASRNEFRDHFSGTYTKNVCRKCVGIDKCAK